MRRSFHRGASRVSFLRAAPWAAGERATVSAPGSFRFRRVASSLGRIAKGLSRVAAGVALAAQLGGLTSLTRGRRESDKNTIGFGSVS